MSCRAFYFGQYKIIVGRVQWRRRWRHIKVSNTQYSHSPSSLSTYNTTDPNAQLFYHCNKLFNFTSPQGNGLVMIVVYYPAHRAIDTTIQAPFLSWYEYMREMKDAASAGSPFSQRWTGSTAIPESWFSWLTASARLLTRSTQPFRLMHKPVPAFWYRR